MTLPEWLRLHFNSTGTMTYGDVGAEFVPGLATPEQELPRVVFSVDSREEFSQASCPPTHPRLVRYGVTMDCYARDYDTAFNVGLAVIKDAYAAFNQAPAQRVDVSSAADLVDPEPGLFHRSITLVVSFLEE